MEQPECTAAKLDRRSRRRWFQFSLRGLLALLTVFAIGLGWKVEKARKRGRAIDAVVHAGGDVMYDGYLRIREETGANHFYLDLEGIPVDVGVREPINASIGLHLSQIYNIRSLYIESVSDSALQNLDHVDVASEIVLLHAEAVTDAAFEDFRRKHSHVCVGLTRARGVAMFGPFAECNN